jgi:hypothetical protein
MKTRIALLAALTAVVCAPLAHAAAPGTPEYVCQAGSTANHLAADATVTGLVGLRFYDHRGARVLFYECIDGQPKRLGARRVEPDPATNPPAEISDAVQWTCDRTVRKFAALAALPDGEILTGFYSVRTPSCAQRFELDASRRVATGKRFKVRAVDQWGLGAVKPSLCVAPPGAKLQCRELAFKDAVATTSRSIRADVAGRWRVELRQGDKVRRRTTVLVGAGRAAAAVKPPIVLATGDSTMQGIDSFLTDRLGDDAIVRSDIYPGSGISRGVFWPRKAVEQTKAIHPRVTIISVGAATDAIPLPNAAGTLVECCEEAWIRAYSRRVRGMMKTYLRDGHARVFWLTPPFPKAPARAQITYAIDDAITRAGRGLKGVVVGRVDRYFSPNGYVETIRYKGRSVRVRESDGVHLSIEGTSIVAEILAPAIRKALKELGAST